MLKDNMVRTFNWQHILYPDNKKKKKTKKVLLPRQILNQFDSDYRFSHFRISWTRFKSMLYECKYIHNCRAN